MHEGTFIVSHRIPFKIINDEVPIDELQVGVAEYNEKNSSINRRELVGPKSTTVVDVNACIRNSLQ